MFSVKSEHENSRLVVPVKKEQQRLDEKPIKAELSDIEDVKWEPKMILNTRAMYYSQWRRDIKKAMRIYNHLVIRDPASLSNRETSSLTWAETIILKDTFNKMRRKSVRSHKDNLAINHRKNKVYQLGIADFGKFRGRYSPEKGKLVQRAFNKVVVNHILSNPHSSIPTYSGVFWFNGMTIIDCKNKFSFDFARTAIGELRPWKKSILRPVELQQMLVIFRGSIIIPDFDLNRSDVLRVLRSQNPSYDLESWRVLQEIPHENETKEYILLLIEPPIRLVENGGMNLYFGADEVYLRLLPQYVMDDSGELDGVSESDGDE